jgi:phosphatidylglycerophosphate synthase
MLSDVSGLGALLALVFGVWDGLDGKLARLKAQTTKLGKGEHVLDYFIEMSWWTALAHHFQVPGQVQAYLRLPACFFWRRFPRTGGEMVDCAATCSEPR